MSVFRSSAQWIASILSLAMLIQGPILQAADQSSDVRFQDVELRDGGVLTTRVLNTQGMPIEGQTVSIEYKGKPVASAVSDQDGLIAVTSLRPGTHVIITATSATPCRFWAPGTAPPNSVTLPAVISDPNADVVRGQFGAFNLPMIVYGGMTIAALIVAVSAENSASDAEDEAAALARRVKDLEDASP